jgi:DNA-binding beta-propeller fold protein YncE
LVDAGAEPEHDTVARLGIKARSSVTIARRAVTGLVALIAAGAFAAAAASADTLNIGEGTDNTIQSFSAMGNPLGAFIPASPTGATGPRGILHLRNGKFVVAYQNPGLPVNGEIDELANNGAFERALVPGTDANAPFAPRGIILGPDNRTLYVADFGAGAIGAVDRYDVNTGKFLGALDFSSFFTSSDFNGEFHPRGLVFAPDRRTLYVTLFSENAFPEGGWVLSYDIATGQVRVIASNNPNAPASNDCHAYLNAPEGVTIGPDQNLYVIGRRPDLTVNPAAVNTDKVLVLNRFTGACRPWINLDQPDQEQPSYAQSLLFGPEGRLYLPIRGGGLDTGGVRSYNVCAHRITYTLVVQPQQIGGAVADWWFLTFGRTDPTTLAYSHQP